MAMRAEVSARPACAPARLASIPKPARTGAIRKSGRMRTSSPTRSAARARALPLPPWAEKTAIRRKPRRPRPSQSCASSAASTSCGRLTVPGNSRCSLEAPTGTGRATAVPPRSRAARSATAPAIRVSVASGRWGPCCSVAPSGSNTVCAISWAGIARSASRQSCVGDGSRARARSLPRPAPGPGGGGRGRHRPWPGPGNGALPAGRRGRAGGDAPAGRGPGPPLPLPGRRRAGSEGDGGDRGPSGQRAGRRRDRLRQRRRHQLRLQLAAERGPVGRGGGLQPEGGVADLPGHGAGHDPGRPGRVHRAHLLRRRTAWLLRVRSLRRGKAWRGRADAVTRDRAGAPPHSGQLRPPRRRTDADGPERSHAGAPGGGSPREPRAGGAPPHRRGRAGGCQRRRRLAGLRRRPLRDRRKPPRGRRNPPDLTSSLTPEPHMSELDVRWLISVQIQDSGWIFRMRAPAFSGLTLSRPRLSAIPPRYLAALRLVAGLALAASVVAALETSNGWQALQAGVVSLGFDPARAALICAWIGCCGMALLAGALTARPWPSAFAATGYLALTYVWPWASHAVSVPPILFGVRERLDALALLQNVSVIVAVGFLVGLPAAAAGRQLSELVGQFGSLGTSPPLLRALLLGAVMAAFLVSALGVESVLRYGPAHRLYHPAPTAGAAHRGQVLTRLVHSRAQGADIPVAVYLPPSYQQSLTP